MEKKAKQLRRRGRPPAGSTLPAETRQAIIDAGMVLLTEKGVSATGIEEVLNVVGIPKGSFYHYFKSKEAFVLEVIGAYGAYFDRKLKRHLENKELRPLERIESFMDDAKRGMARHEFRRGCLIGNLGQEVSSLSEKVRIDVEMVISGWEALLATCLQEALSLGYLSPDANPAALSAFFWTGWEGAVMRARMSRSLAPMVLFGTKFLEGIRR